MKTEIVNETSEELHLYIFIFFRNFQIFNFYVNRYKNIYEYNTE